MSPAPLPLCAGDTILVSRTDRIGDLVLALPLIQTLKRRYPDCRIAALVSAYAAPVLEGHPDVSDIVTIDPAALRYRSDLERHVIRQVRSYSPTAAILLFPDPSVCRLVRAAGIPYRLGTARRWSAVWFNRWVWHSRKVSRRHEASYNLDYLAFFADGSTSGVPKIQVSPGEQAAATAQLAALGISGPFVMLHPGSGGSAQTWPLDRFVALATVLENTGTPCLFTGSTTEAPLILAEAARQKLAVRSMAGRTSLRELAGLASRASVTVANSTGPLHLAAAVGTRVVGLYPRDREMSPVRWGPLGAGHQVLQPSRACRCRQDCTCMATIELAEVLRAIEVVIDADN